MRLVNGPQADPTKSISSNGAQYVAQQMKWKSDEEKSKHAGLAQQK